MSTVARVSAEIDLKNNLSEKLDKASGDVKKFGEKAKNDLGDPPEKAKPKWDAFAESVGKIGDKLAGVGQKLTASITLPLLAAAAAATKLSMEFDDAMVKLSSAAGLTAKEVESLRGEVLKLSSQTGKPAKELADGLYYVASMGYRGKEALDILNQSARLSAVGFGNTADIAKTVTFAVNAYGKENLNAAKAADIFAVAVREGAMAPDQLAGALGRTLGVAANFGLGFDKLMGSLAGMTRMGISVDEGVTAIRATMLTVLHPSKQVEEALQAIGIKATATKTATMQVHEAMKKDLIGTLTQLANASGKGGEEFAKIFPNVRALAGVLSLTGKNADAVREILNATADSTGAAGKAFDIASQSAGFKFRQALESLKNAGIALGDTLAPVVEKIGATVKDLADRFAALPDSTKQSIVQFAALAAAIGPVLLVVGTLASTITNLIEFGGLVAGAWEAMTASIAASGGVIAAAGGVIEALSGPIGWVILAVTALAAAYATNFAGIRDVVNGVWDDIKTTFGDWIGQVQKFMADNKDIITYGWNVVVSQVRTLMVALGQVIRVAWELIKGVVSLALDVILTTLNAFKHLFTGNWAALWEDIKGFTLRLLYNVANIVYAALSGILNIVASFADQFGELFGQKNWGGTLRSWAGSFDEAMKGVQQMSRDTTGVLEAETGKQAKALKAVKPPALPKTGGAAITPGTGLNIGTRPTDDEGGKGKKGKKADDELLGKDIVAAFQQATFGSVSPAVACAHIASQALQALGVKVPTIDGAAALTKAVANIPGAVKVALSDLKPGDFIDYHGRGYGAGASRGAIGDHVGMYVGNGMIADDHHRTMGNLRPLFSDYDRAHDPTITAYRVPEKFSGRSNSKDGKGDVSNDQEDLKKALAEVMKLQGEITAEQLKQTGATLREVLAVKEYGKSYQEILDAARTQGAGQQGAQVALARILLEVQKEALAVNADNLKTSYQVTAEKLKQSGADARDVASMNEYGKLYAQLAKEASDPTDLLAQAQLAKINLAIDRQVAEITGATLQTQRQTTLEVMKRGAFTRDDVKATADVAAQIAKVRDAQRDALAYQVAGVKYAELWAKAFGGDKVAGAQVKSIGAAVGLSDAQALSTGAEAYKSALKDVQGQLDKLRGTASLTNDQLAKLKVGAKAGDDSWKEYAASMGAVRLAMIANSDGSTKAIEAIDEQIDALLGKLAELRKETALDAATKDMAARVKEGQAAIDKLTGRMASPLNSGQVAALGKALVPTDTADPVKMLEYRKALNAARQSLGEWREALVAAGVPTAQIDETLDKVIKNMRLLTATEREQASQGYYADYMKKLTEQIDAATKSSDELLDAQIRQGLQGITDLEEWANDYTKLWDTIHKAKNAEQAKKEFDGFIGHMQDGFKKTLDELWQGGIKNFFGAVVSGIRQMVDDIAKAFLELQAKKALVWLISQIGGSKAGVGAFDALFPGHASGGMVFAGQPTMVGEAGKELFVPQANGYIVPNYGLTRPPAPTGSTRTPNERPSVTQHITVNVSTPNLSSFRKSGTQVAAEMLGRASRANARNGG